VESIYSIVVLGTSHLKEIEIVPKMNLDLGFRVLRELLKKVLHQGYLWRGFRYVFAGHITF